MVWKRNNRSQVNSQFAGVIDKAARWMLSLQRKGADRLNGVVAGMPIRQVKLALLIFCLLSFGSSGYLIIGALIGEKKEAPTLYIEQTSVPKHYDEAGDAGVGEDKLDGHTAEQLKAVKTYMDSLARHDPKAYDSLLLGRRGLMDTVRALEEIYLTK